MFGGWGPATVELGDCSTIPRSPTTKTFATYRFGRMDSSEIQSDLQTLQGRAVDYLARNEDGVSLGSTDGDSSIWSQSGFGLTASKSIDDSVISYFGT